MTVMETTLSDLYLEHRCLHDCCEWQLMCVLHTEGSMIAVSMQLTCVLHTERLHGCCEWAANVCLAH